MPAAETPPARPPLPSAQLEQIRRSRRHPRLTQFDGLHLRLLRDDLQTTLQRLPGPVNDVLDVFCGTRPYEDLLPVGARCVGLDIDDHYGCADVVSTEFLPFDDESFDLVMSVAGFYYVEDPVAGAAELARVLRPGGSVLISVPLIWDYDRELVEHRYTGPQLARLFADWDDVRVIENGGRGASWAMVTGRLFALAEQGVPAIPRRIVHPLFAAVYFAINLMGMGIEALERRYVRGSHTLPVNLLLTARKPS